MATAKGLKIIKQAKLDFAKAQKVGDEKGMAKAHKAADLARGFTTKTGLENGKYIQRVTSATALPRAKKAIPTFQKVLTEYNISQPGIGNQIAKTLPMAKKQEIAQGTAKFFEGAPVQAGFMQGVSLNNPLKSLERKIGTPINAPTDSNWYKAGEIGGTIAQFALPYAGATKGVGLATKALLPSLGKIGTNVARSVGTDLAVGLPLNVNMAYNKQGLKGNDALKNIAMNTGIDLIAGGVLETLGVVLKSGKKVANKVEFDKLPDVEKVEVLEQVNLKVPKTKTLKPQEKITQIKKEVPTDANTMRGLENEVSKNVGQILKGASAKDKAYIQQSISEHRNGSVNVDALYERINAVAKNIPYMKAGSKETVNSIKGYLKSGIKITDDLRQIPDFNDFRKANVGKIRFSPDGRDVDSLYEELADQYGSLFPREITHPVDRLDRIIKVIDSSNPKTIKVGDALSDREISDNFVLPVFNEVDDLKNLSRSTVNAEVKTLVNPTFKAQAKPLTNIPVKPFQPIPQAIKPQTLPQAPKLTVEPIKLELGTKLPQEQVFAPKADIPKFKDLGADVNSNLPVSNISKVRSNTIENSPLFEKAKLQMEESDYAYDVIPEKQSLAEAKQRLEADFDGEVADLPSKGYFDGVDMDTSMGVMENYIIEAERTGNWAKAREWSKVIREKGTQGGQLIQAFAKYTRTPEGAVIKGQQEVAKVEKAIKEKNPTLIGKVETETKQLKKALEKTEGDASEEVGKTLKDYAEALAIKVGGTTKIQSTMKNNALNDMVNELFRVAKESPLPTKTTTQRNPIQILANAVQNKGEFADVWNQAKLIVSDKYKNNPEILNVLDDYFDKGIVPTYSQATLGKSVVKSAKELGIDFSKIIKQSSGDKEKAFKDISEYLVKEVNASESDVASFANDILAKYNEILKTKTESALKLMFKEPVKKGKKSTYEKVMDLINMGAYDDEALKDIMRARNNIPVLEDADIKGILDNMRLSDSATDPYMKKMYSSRAEQIISDKVPATFMEKFAGLQRQSMLINPKTLLTRNPLGNVVLGTAENIKDIPGSAIDKLISLKTGQRTTTLNPNLGAQAKGAAKGLGDWAKDIKYGVDTSPTRAQFELPNHRVYNNKFLNATDKFLSKALQLGDRPFYQAALDGRMAELKKLGVVGEEAEENARLFALDRVFQNDSVLSKNALAIRDKLGLPGRLIMPFAQTPANIMDKLLDYSPLGMAKAVSQMGTVGKGTFNQKLFVDRIGRTFTGTGIALLGYAMAKNGLLTGNTYDPTNKDLNAANTLAGVQSYAIKLGDTWQSYDFAQPIGGLLAASADVYNSGKDGKDFVSSLGIGTVAAVNTVFNQSFMSGLLDAFSGYSPAEGIGGSLLSSTTQITPTILNNIAKTIDTTARETYDPNTFKQQANKLIARIPFASRTLPGKLDASGKPIVLNQGRGLGSRLAENFIAPQKVTQIVKDPVNDEVLRLNKATGDNGVLLNTATKTISKGNETFTLTTREYGEFQKTMGQMAYKEIETLQKTDWYKGMSDTQKADMIVKINTQSKKIAQNSILNGRGIETEAVSKVDYTNKANYEFGLLSKEKQEKAKPVLVSGVSKEQYTTISNKLDLNDNGAVSQDEAKQILNSSGLTQKQKAQMWQAINKSWKHNPFA